MAGLDEEPAQLKRPSERVLSPPTVILSEDRSDELNYLLFARATNISELSSLTAERST